MPSPRQRRPGARRSGARRSRSNRSTSRPPCRGHRRRLDHRSRAVALPPPGHRHLRQRSLGAEPGAQLRPRGGVPLSPPRGTPSAGAVHIRLDPAAVDVNVHPTKAEVKFVDERAACRAVQRAVHTALARRSHDDLPHGAIRADPDRAAGTAAANSLLATSVRRHRYDRIRTRQGDARLPTARASAHPSGVPMLRVLGQIAASFIIAEGPDGMYLIDQHAAHERVLYERILTQLRERAVDRQTLLDPLVVDLSPEEMTASSARRPSLPRLASRSTVGMAEPSPCAPSRLWSRAWTSPSA